MTAEIICVGNELLYGDTLNTNTKYLSQQLAGLGIDVRYQLVVGDHEEDLMEAIRRASDRVDVILFSGGLGPTYDDMTKETLAKVLDQPLVLDEAAYDAIKSFFQRLGRPMAASNKKQAYRPSGGECLPNPNGTAPGIHVMDKNIHYFLLPGPPNELIPMFQEQVKPRLQALESQVILSRNFGLTGIGESSLVGIIGHIMDHSENPRIAPYAKTGSVNIRITAKGENLDICSKMMKEVEEALLPLIGPYVYTDCGEEMEEVVVRILGERGMTLATAESCTGGMISGRIVGVAGASDVFMNGFVTYSNMAKTKWVGVPEEMIMTYGAVSEEVAVAMAEGVRMVSATDFGLSVTGIAGPGGGSEEKPVGTVVIAVADDMGTEVQRYQFTGNRQKVREISAQYALNMLYQRLKG